MRRWLDPGPVAGAENVISRKPKCISQKFQHGEWWSTRARVPSDGLDAIGKENLQVSWDGETSGFSGPVCGSSHCSPVCYILLPFLSRLKRDGNAVMTNGRSWKDLLDNYQCCSSLNFPLVSHYFIWGESTTHITPQILSFYLLALG